MLFEGRHHKTSRASSLTLKYRRDLLKECYATEKRRFHLLTAKCDEQDAYLKSKLNTPDYNNISTIISKAYDTLQGSKIFVFHGGHEIFFSKTCCSCCFLVI